MMEMAGAEASSTQASSTIRVRHSNSPHLVPNDRLQDGTGKRRKKCSLLLPLPNVLRFLVPTRPLLADVWGKGVPTASPHMPFRS